MSGVGLCRTAVNEQVVDQLNHGGVFIIGVSEVFRRHAFQGFKICLERN